MAGVKGFIKKVVRDRRGEAPCFDLGGHLSAGGDQNPGMPFGHGSITYNDIYIILYYY